MKLRYIFGILLLLAFGFACQSGTKSSATDPTKTVLPADSEATNVATTRDGEPIKAALDSIFDHAMHGDCIGMASMLVYKEGDGSDTWHRGMRYEVPEEQLATEKECAKLQVLVTGLQEHRYLEFATEQEKEGEWLLWKVALQYQDGESDEKVFAFLKVGEDYLLGDID
ncbi:MAG: hypothetical protein RLZZ519_1248 [Bacteroidota bacterium]|jgi:hypothetical protein